MRRFLASLLIAVCGGTASAQQADPALLFPVQDSQSVSSIITVDVDGLFSQSLFGQRIGEQYNEGREALALENGRIASALRDEELALAEQRPDMSPDVFLQEAEAFDAKAQAIRRAQDAKERELESTLSQGRTQFLAATRPILGALMVDRGAVAILDRRSVLLSLGSADVTQEALARIDAAIGDGSNLPAVTNPEN